MIVSGLEAKHYGEQCSYCHWHMEGALKRKPGELSVEIWCGAGLDDLFMTGRTCANRVPWVEISFSLEDSSELGLEGSSDLISIETGDLSFIPKVDQWIARNIPKTIITGDDFDAEGSCIGFTVRFDSVRDYLLFKVFWL